MNSPVDATSPLETHPYNSLPIPPDTKILIVGTAPPPRFSLPRPPFGGPKEGLDADFFYGSEHNLLWHYLKLASGEPAFADPGTPEALAEDTESIMQDYLRRHRIWMRDVLQTYRRKKERPDSPLDVDIDLTAEGTTYLDFFAVLEAGRNIGRIVFTGVKASDWFFGKVLPVGRDAAAAKHYRRLFLDADAARKTRSGSQQYTDEFCRADISGRVIRFHVAPSPSGSAGASEDKRYVDIYRRIIFDQD